MIASMTAFARGTTQAEWGYAVWEVRSVNHRYLDVTFKIPDGFRCYESDWRELSVALLQRGKVECALSFYPRQEGVSTWVLNEELVSQLVSCGQKLAQHPGVQPITSAIDLMRWPEVMTALPRDLSPLESALSALLRTTLEGLVQARQREGQQLHQLLTAKLTHMREYLNQARERTPECVQQHRRKLRQKLSEIQGSLDPLRVEQEILIFAQRIDVEEEIERLGIHIKECARLLEMPGAMGRRLDFLMQEMNREANTLGAKAQDAELTKIAIELKVLIEQMREQIQNVE